MSRKISVKSFKLVANSSQFNKYFIENYSEDNYEGYFLGVDVQYQQKLKLKLKKMKKL